MSIETVDKAFEPFFTTKETGKGTGLGFEPSLRFTKQSNGTSKSTASSARARDQALSARYHGDEVRRPIELGDSQRGQGETILIVEDDEGVRQYAAEISSEFNYQVIEAKDASSRAPPAEAEKKFDLDADRRRAARQKRAQLADEV